MSENFNRSMIHYATFLGIAFVLCASPARARHNNKLHFNATALRALSATRSHTNSFGKLKFNQVNSRARSKAFSGSHRQRLFFGRASKRLAKPLPWHRPTKTTGGAKSKNTRTKPFHLPSAALVSKRIKGRTVRSASPKLNTERFIFHGAGKTLRNSQLAKALSDMSKSGQTKTGATKTGVPGLGSSRLNKDILRLAKQNGKKQDDCLEFDCVTKQGQTTSNAPVLTKGTGKVIDRKTAGTLGSVLSRSDLATKLLGSSDLLKGITKPLQQNLNQSAFGLPKGFDLRGIDQLSKLLGSFAPHANKSLVDLHGDHSRFDPLGQWQTLLAPSSGQSANQLSGLLNRRQAWAAEGASITEQEALNRWQSVLHVTDTEVQHTPYKENKRQFDTRSITSTTRFPDGTTFTHTVRLTYDEETQAMIGFSEVFGATDGSGHADVKMSATSKESGFGTLQIHHGNSTVRTIFLPVSGHTSGKAEEVTTTTDDTGETTTWIADLEQGFETDRSKTHQVSCEGPRCSPDQTSRATSGQSGSPSNNSSPDSNAGTNNADASAQYDGGSPTTGKSNESATDSDGDGTHQAGNDTTENEPEGTTRDTDGDGTADQCYDGGDSDSSCKDSTTSTSDSDGAGSGGSDTAGTGDESQSANCAAPWNDTGRGCDAPEQAEANSVPCCGARACRTPATGTRAGGPTPIPRPIHGTKSPRAKSRRRRPRAAGTPIRPRWTMAAAVSIRTGGAERSGVPRPA